MCCTGGHNVIAGVLDYITERHPGSALLGFRGGPGGILARDFMEITQDKMVSHPGISMSSLHGWRLLSRSCEIPSCHLQVRHDTCGMCL